MPVRSRYLIAALSLLAAIQAASAEAGEAVYLDKDASRCDIFRALSGTVPDECQAELVDKTPVIHPAPLPAATAPAASAPSAARPSPPRVASASERPRPATSRPAPKPSAPRPSRPIPSGERAMATPIEFAFDSDRLTSGAKQHLDNIAEVLKDALLENVIVRVEGHTDATGPADYNLALSRRRAQAVQDYLASYHSIGRDRIPILGKGESDPFDSKRPRAGVNRRVEFVNTGLKP